MKYRFKVIFFVLAMLVSSQNSHAQMPGTVGSAFWNTTALLPANWWSSNWRTRAALTVVASTDALPANYSVAYSFNHAALVSSNKSLASGDDLRVIYWNGSAAVEIDRVLDKVSSWNNASTKIWFKLQTGISASGSSSAYFIYYNYSLAAAPMQNADNIFLLYDDFSSTTLNLGKWTADAGCAGNTISVTGGQLKISGTEAGCPAYGSYGINSVATFTSDYLVDSEFSIVTAGSQPDWKASFGNPNIYVDSYSSADKRWRYYSGGWQDVGDSALDASSFSDAKIRQIFSSDGALKSYEGGVLKSTRTGVPTTALALSFYFGPDSGSSSSFDVRWDNIVVRAFVATDSSIAMATMGEEII